MSLIFSLVFLFSIAIAPAAFALNGEGTKDNPYLITSQDDLEAFRDFVNEGGDNVGAHAKLTQDITLEDDWTPIGNEYANSFTGTFDGGGYTITGLTIRDADTSNGYCGLFGYFRGRVMNLTLEDVSIDVTSSSYIINAGAVAGYCYSGTIEGCTVTGSIYAKSQSVVDIGGIAGKVDSSSISNCINSAEEAASASDLYIGGIVGEVVLSSLTNCGYLKTSTVNSGVGNAVGSGSPTTDNVGIFSDENALDYIAFELTPSLIGDAEYVEGSSYTMAADDTMTISFDAWPGKFANAYVKGGVNITYESSNDVVDITTDDEGTITVSGKNTAGDTTIDITAMLYTYKFNDGSVSDGYDESSEESTESITFTLSLSAEQEPADSEDNPADDDNPTDSVDEPVSETSTGGSGGGCNTGTGALALLALIPLALRRKR